MKHRLLVSLGSNVLPSSARLLYLASAVKLIGSRIGRVIETSGLYESITAYVDHPALPISWPMALTDSLEGQSLGMTTSRREEPKVDHKHVNDHVELHTTTSSTSSLRDYPIQPPNGIPPHLNAVLLLETDTDDPEAVLKELQCIEIELGRKRQTGSQSPHDRQHDPDSSRSNPHAGPQSVHSRESLSRLDHTDAWDRIAITTTSTSSGSPLHQFGTPPHQFGTPPDDHPLAPTSAASDDSYDPTQRRNIPFDPIRSIDLDMLLFDTLTWRSPMLTLPHPGLMDRNFILVPLRDVDPNATIPRRVTDPHGTMQPQSSPPASLSVQSCILRNLSVTSGILDPLHSIPIPVFAPRSSMLWPYGPGFLPRIMGVLNITPDSFSDGGLYYPDHAAIMSRAQQMITEGVDIIDVGGESTAPGRPELSTSDELRRVIPIIESIRKISDIPISVDTRKAQVLEASILAGADVLNDVSGGLYDSNVLEVAAMYQIPVILGHMRGTPELMHTLTVYEDLISDVARELNERIEAAKRVGIPRWRIMVDVGLGFAKSGQQNIELLRNLEALASKLPSGICQAVGFSRKAFLGDLANILPARSITSGQAPTSLELTSPEETEKRDYAGIALLAGLAKQQLEEANRPIEQSERRRNASCVALIRTHKIQESKIALHVISTVFSNQRI